LVIVYGLLDQAFMKRPFSLDKVIISQCPFRGRTTQPKGDKKEKKR